MKPKRPLNPGKEKLTGKELHEDLLKRKEWQVKGFKSELRQGRDLKELDEVFREIKKDCKENNCFPIIHFEIHGRSDKNGFILASGESIFWEQLCVKLSEINCLTGNNLFITLAVCHGAFLIRTITPVFPAPFWGFIGSFEIIKVDDLMIRYEKFYDEFLTSFDLDKAIDRLHQANPDLPSSYQFISSEQVFIDVMKRYFETKFSKEAIQNQFLNGIQKYLINRSKRRWMEREFKKELLRGRRKIFNENRMKFFMQNQFPENIERFKVEYNDVKKYRY